jgi:hypothetical protein
VPLSSLTRDTELGVQARPMPGKEEIEQEDGSATMKGELKESKTEERPDTSNGMVGLVRTDGSATGKGPA